MNDPLPIRVPVRTVAAVFFRLGATSFGGPAAHIALMEDEFVRRRGWISREEFLDLIGAANLIPGPNSTEVAIHIGARVAGAAGLIAAGAAFIAPAVLLTLAFAWLYVEYGTLPQARAILAGIQPVILALIAKACWTLGQSAIRTWRLAMLASLCVTAALLRWDELVILLVAGLVALTDGRENRGAATMLPMPAFATAAVPAVGPGPLFWTFAKIGSVLFGSGYVLIAFLRTEFVDRTGWLTERQLLDAVAAGQTTPGPVFSTATFVGYVLAGFPGAAAATLGIFLPAFVFVAATAPLVRRLRQSASASAFLDGVNVASLALMVVAGGQIAVGTFSWLSVPIFAASLILLVRTKLNPTWLIAGGAVLGWVAAR